MTAQFTQFAGPHQARAELRRLTASGAIDFARPVVEALAAVGLADEFAENQAARDRLASVAWYGPAEPYLAPTPGAPPISDILLNGDGPIVVVQGGLRQRTSLVPHPEWVEFLQRQLLVHGGVAHPASQNPWPAPGGRDETLLIGSAERRIRFAMTRPPATPAGPTLALRILPERWRTIDDLIADEILTAEIRDALLHALRSGASVLVAGGTGSGKTTVTAALLLAIAQEKRVVVIEEATELPQLPDGVAMEVSRSGHPFSDFVRFSLRQKPDLIVLGEVRGSEALTMLQAAATGHPGIGTIHAPDPQTALANLERMACEEGSAPPDVVRRMIGTKAAPLLVCHIGRYGGRRRLGQVAEVLPQTGASAGAGFVIHPLFCYEDQRGYVRRPASGEWAARRY